MNVTAVLGLTFDPVLHQYRIGNRIVPSVTEILKATGVSVDFDALAGLSHRIGAAINDKRELGRALHADAHAYDDNDLDLRLVDPRVRPYLDAYITWRENSGLQPLGRERRVYHPVLVYAGTFDGLFRTRDGAHILVDLKTGDPEAAGARYQLAGYQLAAQAGEPGLPIHQRWSVQLTPEHRTPYRVTPYFDFRDFDTWKAIVATFYAQPGRRTA